MGRILIQYCAGTTSAMFVKKTYTVDEETDATLREEAEKVHLSMSAVLRILAKRLRDGEVRLL